MKDEELKKIKKILTYEISKVNDNIIEYKKSTKPISPENSIGRVSRMDAINNKSVVEAALRNAEKKLKGLKIILSKIHNDDFGICIRCKTKIPIERILIVPETEKCVHCSGR